MDLLDRLLRIKPADYERPDYPKPAAPPFTHVGSTPNGTMTFGLTADGTVWGLTIRSAGWWPIEAQPVPFVRLQGHFAQDRDGQWWEWLGWINRETRNFYRLPSHQYVKPEDVNGAQEAS